ncbi:MAG: DegT/DnrJ/EryC1/StrS family aminotransferase [Mesorhizobium sp.]|uniref:DegT/DnrJ/EryC1/StrS family aminotransferase n=1 Tax=Mesorhizobium sp. TaxID=1871066 RepID=UPI000FE90D38|nr:DegT/DnrJ/EryC1/StrS family aminotransferase [Mesorhizobium sp.]RWO23575.1 MAG: DegT/DnrJ/EryC1/StrS family aminotransferase [Mesorhizobium sp.]
MLRTFVNSPLALLGGPELGADLCTPIWPPRDEQTALELAELYLSGNWSFDLGGNETAFAKEFAAAHGANFGVMMINGTVTLQCALAVLGIGPGDEVIVPAYTWFATAMAARYVGAKIVFVDVEPTTLCLDPSAVEAAITPRTRAVIPVHLYGSMVDMDALMAIANRHGLLVIEDCAQAHGGKWAEQPVGSIGHIGSFSFQHNKLMTSGEGGACLTNNADIADRLYRMKHIGYGPGEGMGKFTRKPDPDLICYNFRVTEFQALILRRQLQAIPGITARYNAHARLLDERLANVPGVRAQARGSRANSQSFYKWIAVFDEEPLASIPIDRIIQAVNAEGLPMERTYGAVYKHTLFNLPRRDYRISGGKCTVTETIAAERAAQLSHQWLGSDETIIHRVADILAKVSANADQLRALS